ncbi:MAG TPA: hypothetical protein DCQ12_05270, partial [Candidatus Cloacimonas sp.]|nr:hypothetical protein [Candidatus Cloacimonas sp.]
IDVLEGGFVFAKPADKSNISKRLALSGAGLQKLSPTNIVGDYPVCNSRFAVLMKHLLGKFPGYPLNIDRFFLFSLDRNSYFYVC